MKILKVLVVKPALIGFTKVKKRNSIHYQTVTTTALTYLLKIVEPKMGNNRMMHVNLEVAFVSRDHDF